MVFSVVVRFRASPPADMRPRRRGKPLLRLSGSPQRGRGADLCECDSVPQPCLVREMHRFCIGQRVANLETCEPDPKPTHLSRDERRCQLRSRDWCGVAGSWRLRWSRAAGAIRRLPGHSESSGRDRTTSSAREQPRIKGRCRNRRLGRSGSGSTRQAAVAPAVMPRCSDRPHATPIAAGIDA
jgi:hypothetical protein